MWCFFFLSMLFVTRTQIRRNYPQAIQSLQIALRANPDDALLWLRLGEAYNNAGRQVAATKALERAKELSIDDWMCSYLLGDVRRQLGQFTDAIDIFQKILIDRHTELGVLVSLSQTYIDCGHDEARTGFTARSETSFVAAIYVSLQIVAEHPGFRSLAWKTIGDSLYALSERTSFLDYEAVVSGIRAAVNHVTKSSEDLAAIVPLDPTACDLVGGLAALEAAILAYHTRLSLSSNQVDSRGGPEYDLGAALLAWGAKLPADDVKAKSAQEKGAELLVRALKEDPWNDLYWLALGTAKFLLRPKTAQHAYLKALDIDPKVR